MKAIIALVAFIFYFSFVKSSFAANPSDVVINEVYYDVDDAHGKETTPINEWIELYNKTASPIDISSWQILDNSSSIKTIPASILPIPVNGVMLISPDASTWNYWNIDSAVIKLVMGIGNGLSNTGDRLILKDNLGNEIDNLSYGTNIDVWNPAISDVDEGHSLERNPGGIDNNAITDFVDQETPTPGKFIAEYRSPSPSSTPTPTQTSTPTSTATPSPSPAPTKSPTPTPIPTKIMVGFEDELATESEILGTSSAEPSAALETLKPETKTLGESENIIQRVFIILGILTIITSAGIFVKQKWIK